MNLLDVHAHYVPDVYREALAAAGHDQPDGFPAVPAWSAPSHVAMLDRLGREHDGQLMSQLAENTHRLFGGHR